MDLIGKTIIDKYGSTVNSSKNNIYTVNSKVEQLLEEVQGLPEEVAQTIAQKLDDTRSLPYFVLLAKNIPHAKLFEALSYTIDAARRGKLRQRKPIYFLKILNNWGFQTKFRKSKELT